MNSNDFRRFVGLSVLIALVIAAPHWCWAEATDDDGFVSVSDQVVESSGTWTGAAYESLFPQDGETALPPSGPNWAESPYNPDLAFTATLTGGAIVFQRVGKDAGTLVQNSLVPGEGLDTTDIDFNSQAGFDVSAVLYSEYHPEVEVRFFSIDDWNERIFVPTTPDVNGLRINTSPLLFTSPGVTAITGEYHSGLHNFETNMRLNLGMFKPLAGFRYIELDERILLGFAPTTNTYDVSTRNRLYGGQIGLLVQTTFNRLSFNLAGKCGVFGNEAGQTTGFFTGLVPVTASVNTAGASVLGEFSANTELHLTKSVSVLAGYQLIGITGVALAANQIQATDLLVNQRGMNRAEVFYHGGVFSVVVRH